MDPKNSETVYDAVIVGAGAAGLSAALGLLRAHEAGEANHADAKPAVLVISKLGALRSHTGSAEGGITASLANVERDAWRWHYYDTVKGGDWLVDQDAAQLLAKYAPETVINLERMGVAFSRTEDGHIAQRRFGGHTADFGRAPVRRAAYAADRIGHQILNALWQQCVAAGIEFAEEWYVTDLVIDEPGDRALGVVAFDTHTGTVHAVHARNVLLATGGAGRLFHTTSNSWDLTGDGMALALAAGLQLEDVEFMQFHPTGLAHTGILLSEAARSEGGTLRNAEGESFMARYAPEHGDLAARDVVSRAIRAEIDAGRGVADPTDPSGPKDCVWLDMTGIDPKCVHEALPQVEETIRTYANLDPGRDLVPVKPTAHYTMGGIPVNVDGEVYRWLDGRRETIEGLFAAGECSCISVHGANRLGGNSLLDACLFGTRAGRRIAARIDAHGPASALRDGDAMHARDDVARAAERRGSEVTALLKRGQDGDTATMGDAVDTTDNPYRLHARLGMVMEEAIAVRCDAQGITRALTRLHDEFEPRAEALHAHAETPAFNQELTAIWEVRHLVSLADAVLRASRSRRESRGSLRRTDFPLRDDAHYLAHSMITQHGDVQWQPVHILDMPPREREY